jgi:hypothetical protein
MPRITLTLFALFLSTCFASSLYGQNPLWTGILDPSRAIDWSKTGATIATTRSQCETSACATVSGGTVTAASINAALASAPPNTYVSIPSGTFTMTTGITFNHQSNITLRGSGSNSTFLVWTSSGGSGNCAGHDICVSSSDTNYGGGPSNSANWTSTNGVSGTYTKGATSIVLSSVANLAVGNPLILDQLDDQSDNGALYVGCEIGSGTSGGDSSPQCYSGAYPSGFQRGSTLSTLRGQQQIVTVTSISGNTVGITPGIYADNYSSSHSPGAWWATSPVQGDAVEDISLDHTNGGDGITFFNCQGCWVKGIRSVRSSTTGTGWGHVYWAICNHCTVRDSYFYGYSGDTYGISVDIASDSLAEDNIFEFPSASQFYNSDCEGCVAGYNFSVATYFSNSSNWMGNSADYHSVNLFALSEGNIGSGLEADSFHGTHALNTVFRNRWDGREQNGGDATTSNTVAVRLNPGARYQNVIGNILGTIGYQTNYKSTTNGSDLYLSVIGCGAYPETGMAGDPLSCQTSMFWGNWDNVTNAVRWNASEVPSGLSSYANPVPASETLPASFYYSSKPSWWPAGKAWPAIGPDVTGGKVGQCSSGSNGSNEVFAAAACAGGAMAPLATVNSIPAMDCYFNAMKGNASGTGSALAFDASTCYAAGSSTSTGPGVPQNLTGVAH